MNGPYPVDPAPLVLRDLMPDLKADPLFDERIRSMRRVLEDPGAAVLKSKRHRVTITVRDGDNPYVVVLRNGLVGGRDGEGGETLWLSLGRSIMLRIEDMHDGAGSDDLSGFAVADVASRLERFAALWSAKTSSFPRLGEAPAPAGPAFQLRDALLDDAMSTIAGHVSVMSAVEGKGTSPMIQMVAHLHGPPTVSVRSDASLIGVGHRTRTQPTQHHALSDALERLVDTGLRGSMLERGRENMHVVMRPVVALMRIVEPASPMEVLRHHADPIFRNLPAEFA